MSNLLALHNEYVRDYHVPKSLGVALMRRTSLIKAIGKPYGSIFKMDLDGIITDMGADIPWATVLEDWLNDL